MSHAEVLGIAAVFDRLIALVIGIEHAARARFGYGDGVHALANRAQVFHSVVLKRIGGIEVKVANVVL